MLRMLLGQNHTLDRFAEGLEVTNYRSRCNYITDTWTTTEHLSGCNEPTCPGCRPCEHDHCASRSRCANHVEHKAGIYTCPSCIGKVRTDLRNIVTLYAVALPQELIGTARIESEAMNLMAIANTVYEMGVCSYPKRPEFHPYELLGRWDMALRETYGPPTVIRVTVPRAADYLAGLLDRGFPHDNPIEFDQFAREVTACMVHMESVIHDSRKPETGALCPKCNDGDSRLIRRYAKEVTDDRNDTWHCPYDGAHWWTHADYLAEVDVTSRESIKEGRWLTASEIFDHYGIKASTVRKWASRDKVRTRWIAESLRYDTRGLKALAQDADTA